MISIIICARSPKIPEALKENIRATIGVPYELVIIDNSENKHSIFEAYNLGIAQSQYPYLCFMHDDILYHTSDWGIRVVSHFKDPEVGVIGVAGTFYLPAVPSGWWWSGHYTERYLMTEGDSQVAILREQMVPDDYSPAEVLAVDGVWFSIRRDAFQKIRFDTQSFTGFHFYDLDICMQARDAGYKVRVVYDVLLEHFSSGTLNARWVENALVFTDKWRLSLPAQVRPLTKKDIADGARGALIQFRDIMHRAGHTPRQINSRTLGLIGRIGSGLLSLAGAKYVVKYVLNRV